jgi:2-desacetyl-2-hydroxyethyl bacteriochlorophyllide A dehydrogenase
MATRKVDRCAVVITSPLEAELASRPLEFAALQPTELLVETEYTVVSAGTELSIFRGKEAWAPLPHIPGYGSVGRVLETGSEVTEFAPGDRVFTYGSHASVNLVSDGLVLKVPESIDGAVAPLLARIGQVAFTSVRVSNAQLGDVVVVQGLGLVGNLAAQLFMLAGCTVIGIDVSPKRVEVAKSCGIDFVIDSSAADPVSAVKEITAGAMSAVVVEATGISNLVATAAAMAAKGGEVILLGTPRGNYDGNATDLLMKVHLVSSQVVLKGAHEWILPLKATPGSKHSIERNVKQLLDLGNSGKLHGRELISHIIAPEMVPDVYNELNNRNDDYFGVIIDWTRL